MAGVSRPLVPIVSNPAPFMIPQLLYCVCVCTTSILLLAAAPVLVLYWRTQRSAGAGRACCLPPGPRWWLPLVGHLHLLGRLPHQSFARLSLRYGPLMSLRLGSRPAIVASSPAMAKLILHTHDSIFAGRPQISTVAKNAFQGYTDILFSPPDSYWKFMRQLCLTEFFTPKRFEYFRPLREQELRELMLSIHAEAGTPVCIRKKMHTINSNIISTMMMGAPLQELNSASPNSRSDIVATVMQVLGLLSVFNVSDFMPWLAWLDLQGYERKSKDAARAANSMLQEVIDRRRNYRSSGTASSTDRDFLDVLLNASLDAQHKHLHIGDQNIKSVLLDMLIAGSETSATIIEWALAELLENPNKLKIVQEELDQNVGSMRLVQECDIPNLPYLVAVINETMRLHAPSPLLSPHMSMETCQISSYKIPAHTLAYVNVWAIHRNPYIWENPLEFQPKRFLNINCESYAQQLKYMPFGLGRRSCPGKKLALLTMQTILANLIHHFNWMTLQKTLFQEKVGLVLELENPLVVVPLPKFPRSCI